MSRQKDLDARLTDVSHVQTTVTLAYADTVLVLIRPLYHHAAPLRFRVLVTFAGHSNLMALSFNFSSKGETFARKVAAGSAYTVSYNGSIQEEEGRTRG